MTFADFIQSSRVTNSPRGDLIAVCKTLINARAFPAVTCWRELYGLMASRKASDETITEARKLWHQFKSLETVA
jgi:hypothetical protein